MDGNIDSKPESLRSMYAIPIRYQGVSSRLTYGFDDTYFIDANFGYTGSENFQKGHRFGFFPSVAAGWVPTQYKWLADNLPWLNFLKIRGSYGLVGNDRLTDERFPYLTLMTNNNSGGGWGSNVGYITEERVGATTCSGRRPRSLMSVSKDVCGTTKSISLSTSSRTAATVSTSAAPRYPTTRVSYRCLSATSAA